MAKLGDICTIYAGTGFPVQYQGNDVGQYPFYKVGDIARNVTQGFVFLTLCENYIDEEVCKAIKGTIIPENTVVFAKIGEAVKLNRRAITTKDCLIDNNAMGIKPNEALINLRYFYHFMCRLKLEEYAEATTVPSVKKTIVEKIDIPLPPLEKQKEIASNLDKVTHTIDLCNAILEKLDLLVKSRFVEMFGDVVINDKCYPVKALPEIAEYWNGLTYKPEDVSEKGTIVLRSSNIQNSCLDFADTVRVSCKIGDKKYVKNNDILMCSRNGSARLVGKVALIDNISEPMSFGAFMMIIRSEYYHYLMTYFQMPAFRMQIATGATTTINQITGNMLDKVQLPVPDMQTIEKFADFVKQVDKSKAAVQKELDKTKMLFDSLMQEYFG